VLLLVKVLTKEKDRVMAGFSELLNERNIRVDDVGRPGF